MSLDINLAETKAWLRKYTSKTGTVYTNLPDGSWECQKKDRDKEKVLNCAYLSRSKFDEICLIIQEKKESSSMTEEILKSLIEDAKYEGYTGLEGRMIAVVDYESGRIRWSSSIVKINPSFN